MNSVVKKAISNFKFVFSGQVLLILLNIIKSMVVPFFLTVQDYGYWQLYLFYTAYVGIFSLGFNDGIYLRYGSYAYEELPHKKLRSAIRIHIIVISTLTFILYLSTNFFVDINKQDIFRYISLNILILGINGVFIYIFQITNQLKKYSFFYILPTTILVIGILISVVLDINSVEFLIIIDLFGKLVTVIGMIISCKELWIGKTAIHVGLSEYRENVSVGFKLMLAQFMGILVTGISRIFVEMVGTIEDYAYYSFGLTIMNIFLVLISSVSLIIFPTLKRLDINNYPRYYIIFNKIVRVLFVISPIFYFLGILFISKFLQKYVPVLDYFNILFLIVLVQSKIQLINNNFYKSLRKEKELLKANIVSVLLFVCLTPVIIYFKKTVFSIALCTLIIMALRCYFSELYLTKLLNIKNIKSILVEVFCIITFLLLSKINLILCIFIYIFSLILLFWNNKNNILYIVNKIMGKVERNNGF